MAKSEFLDQLNRLRAGVAPKIEVFGVVASIASNSPLDYIISTHLRRAAGSKAVREKSWRPLLLKA
jgi:hypothetical protein